MKKLIVVSILICGLFVVGCGGKKASKEESAMKEYATTYFESHLKGDVSLASTTRTITIADLKKAISLLGDQYDMTKLDGCADDSAIDLKLNEAREITETTYRMNCK